MFCFIIFLSSFLFISNVRGHADGAPCGLSTYQDAYHSMHPSTSFHGPDSNDGKPAPYDVLLLDSSNQEATCYSSGKKYTVKIQPKSSNTFKGFIIQARDDSENAVGKFSVGSGVKYQCKEKTNSVTHDSPNDKSKVEVEWSTDREEGKLIFKATVVQELKNYYVQIPSKSIGVC